MCISESNKFQPAVLHPFSGKGFNSLFQLFAYSNQSITQRGEAAVELMFEISQIFVRVLVDKPPFASCMASIQACTSEGARITTLFDVTSAAVGKLADSLQNSSSWCAVLEELSVGVDYILSK